MRTSLDMSCEIRSVSINHKPKTIYLLPSAEREGGFPRLPSLRATHIIHCAWTLRSLPRQRASRAIKSQKSIRKTGCRPPLQCALMWTETYPLLPNNRRYVSRIFSLFFILFWFFVFRFFFTNGIGNNAIYIIYSSLKWQMNMRALNKITFVW